VTAYAAVIGARFRVLLQYRAAALAGLVTQSFFGLVRIMILEAFYRSSTAPPPGLTFTQAAGYVWLGQAMLAMFPWNVDADIRELVRTGNVGYELCRPLDLYGLWFARALAWRSAPMLLRAVPMFVIAMVVLPLVGLPEWRLRPPPSVAAAALWLATLVGALLLSCALTTLMNITLLWTINGQGIALLVASLAVMFGGLVIPLPLAPDWALPVLQLLPFAGTMDLPGRVFTGHIPAAQAGWVLAHQLGWTLVLVAAGRWLLARGTRRLVVQGG
jgi:ABC-2 type transport system permease protein